MVARLPPGPRGNFLLGNMLDFHRDLLGFMTKVSREYGDCVALRIGLKRVFLLTHPDLIESVLVTQSRSFIKHYVLRLLRPTLGNGLLISDGDFWLRQRRLAQPAFNKGRVSSYGDIMVAYTQRMLDGWHDGETHDIHADMTQLALEIVAKALFDADVAVKAREVGAALEEGMRNFIRRWRRLLPMPVWVPTPTNLQLRRVVRRLDDIIYGIIQERRSAGGDRGDLLSLLLNARDEDGSRMTDQQLRDECMTLFLAGHETTANAMAWTWFLLGRHPEVEAKLDAELQSVLDGRAPTVADLPRLRYAEMIIMESMRLYPPVYAFGREATQEVTLGGFRVPKGTTIIMSQWVVHRDPRFFSDPEEFLPERWAGDLLKRIPKLAYFPFGGGPRLCIGNSFAMMEAVLILATIAQRFRFTLLPGHAVVPFPTVTLRPANGIIGIVTKRKAPVLTAV